MVQRFHLDYMVVHSESFQVIYNLAIFRCTLVAVNINVVVKDCNA